MPPIKTGFPFILIDRIYDISRFTVKVDIMFQESVHLLFQLALIFSQAGLPDVTPPCVAQSFINHNGILYKIFVLGEHVFIVERPSLKNFTKTGELT